MNQTPQLAEALNAVLATESRGLLRYIAGIDPHLTGQTRDLFAQMRRMADQSRDREQRICQLMQDLGIEPAATPFPTGTADCHYVSIEALLPRLIDQQRRQVAGYQRALEHVGGEYPVRRELEALLAATVALGQELEHATDRIAGAGAGKPA